MKLGLLLCLFSLSAFAQMPEMPKGWCGQVFCPPPPNPCGPNGEYCRPLPQPPTPAPLPPQPAPPKAAGPQFLKVADTTHWVDISTSSRKIYLDDSNVIVDGHFNGFKALITFGPGKVVDGNTIASEIVLVEYDCHAQVGRGKRLVYIDDQFQEHTIDEMWVSVDRPPATDILEAVKARVCFKTS